MATRAVLEARARQIARKYGIPEAGFLAQIGMESGWNPSARSPAGALGLLQFMPGTAKSLGINPLDPMQAIEGGAKHMAALRRNLGSWDLALAGYNAGGGAVQKYHGVPPYKETQNYVSKLAPYFKGGAAAPVAQGRTVSSGGALDPQAQLQAAAPHVDAGALLGLLQRTSQDTLKGKAPGQDYMRALAGIIANARINPQAEQMGASAAATAPQTARAVVSGSLAPSGGWGGAEGPLKALTSGLPKGFSVSSEKRDRRMTASGGVSDHWTGSKTSFARDIAWGGSSPTPAADALASQFVAALGGPRNWGRKGGVFNITRNGIRWQVLYRTNQGGNHYNHIHVGARRV